MDLEIIDLLLKDQVIDKLIWKHNISEVELRQVFNNQPNIRFIEKGKIKGEHLYVASGRTDAFPFRGMENPRLTFANAIYLTGDRADTSLVAHEFAHSWTGNLVTNASWEDFWLNEGWTTYAEYRICERLYGREYVELAAVRDRNLLFEDYERFRSTPQFTQLKYRMQGVDPEEIFSRVPYYKGLFLLMLIEQSVGREAFDGFHSRLHPGACLPLSHHRAVPGLSAPAPAAGLRPCGDRGVDLHAGLPGRRTGLSCTPLPTSANTSVCSR